MYTLGSLTEMNQHRKYGEEITAQDVHRVNNLVTLIKKSRRDDIPVIGDILHYTTREGEYYGLAHYINNKSHSGTVCLQCYIPHVYPSEHNDEGVAFNCGGGPWITLDLSLFVYAGKQTRTFLESTTSMYKPSIGFRAEVNAWSYTEPDQKYDGYTTEHWDKSGLYFSELPHNSGNYRYTGDKAFVTDEEFKAWVETFNGVVFRETGSLRIVVFHYREKAILLDFEKWDKLPYEHDTRLLNGSIALVKVWYDHSNHTVNCYRFDNSGALSSKKYKAHERARGCNNLSTAWVESDCLVIRKAIGESRIAGSIGAGIAVITEWKNQHQSFAYAAKVRLVERVFRSWAQKAFPSSD